MYVRFYSRGGSESEDFEACCTCALTGQDCAEKHKDGLIPGSTIRALDHSWASQADNVTYVVYKGMEL